MLGWPQWFATCWFALAAFDASLSVLWISIMKRDCGWLVMRNGGWGDLRGGSCTTCPGVDWPTNPPTPAASAALPLPEKLISWRINWLTRHSPHFSGNVALTPDQKTKNRMEKVRSGGFDLKCGMVHQVAWMSHRDPLSSLNVWNEDPLSCQFKALKSGKNVLANPKELAKLNLAWATRIIQFMKAACLFPYFLWHTTHWKETATGSTGEKKKGKRTLT